MIVLFVWQSEQQQQNMLDSAEKIVPSSMLYFFAVSWRARNVPMHTHGSAKQSITP
jgi:hypothetical protein